MQNFKYFMREIYVLHTEEHICTLVIQHFHSSVRYLCEKIWASKSKAVLKYSELLAAILYQNVVVLKA